VVTWEIWPREADLSREKDPIAVYSELTVVERHVSNGAPSWRLQGPAEHLSVFTPGMGCILQDGDRFVASGQATSFGRVYEADQSGRPVDTMTIGFDGDADDVWSRLAWPDPTHALTETPSDFGVVYDERTGARETLILGYIASNLGASAPITSRRLAALLLPGDLERGGSTTYQARMNILGDVVAELAEAGDLDVRVEHDESTGAPRLALVIDQTADVSADVVFGSADSARATGIVTSWGYEMSAPEMTDAILFAAGDLELREGSRYTDEAAVTRWGRRRERLVEQGYTDDLSAIQDAAAQALENAASPVTISLEVADGGDAIYRDTYRLGDRVGIELPGLPLEISSPRVREVVTTVRPGQPDRRTVALGSPGATSIDPPTAARLDEALRRIAKLERNR
jgi:hypothetical protein